MLAEKTKKKKKEKAAEKAAPEPATQAQKTTKPDQVMEDDSDYAEFPDTSSPISGSYFKGSHSDSSDQTVAFQ